LFGKTVAEHYSRLYERIRYANQAHAGAG
jgi:hypothetical protein